MNCWQSFIVGAVGFSPFLVFAGILLGWTTAKLKYQGEQGGDE
jgi:hypothetical protein